MGHPGQNVSICKEFLILFLLVCSEHLSINEHGVMNWSSFFFTFLGERKEDGLCQMNIGSQLSSVHIPYPEQGTAWHDSCLWRSQKTAKASGQRMDDNGPTTMLGCGCED